MEVELPDGTIIEDIPEGMTKAQLAQKLQSGGYKVPQEWIGEVKQEKQSALDILTDPRAYARTVKGVGEGVASIGTGMAATAVGGLAAIPDLFTGEDAGKTVQDYQRMFTYQPTTVVGKAIPQIAAYPIEKASELGGFIGRNSELAQLTGTTTGAEAIGEVAPVIAATLYGGRAPIKSVAQGVSSGGKGMLPRVSVPGMPNIPIVSDGLGMLKDIGIGLRNVIRTRDVGGQKLLAQDYLKSITTPEEAVKLVKAVEKNSSEIIPGSPVTTADALARANRESVAQGAPERIGGQFVALQDKLGKAPELTSKANTVKLVQEQARNQIIEKGAGTPAEYSAAENARADAVRPLYKAVEKSTKTVDLTPAVKYIDLQLSKRTGEPKLISALSQVKSGLVENAKPINVLSSIDGIKSMMADIENKSILKELGNTKRILERRLENSVPEAKLATQTYKEMSKDINRMNMWRELQKKYESANEVETPGMYLKTLNDQQALIKKTTGFKRGNDLTKYLEPDQVAKAMQVAKELESNLTKKQMTREVSIGDAEMVKTGNVIPNTLNQTTTLANFAIRTLGRDANVPVARFAQEILADPKAFAKLMRSMEPKQRQSMLQALKSIANTDTAIVAGAQQGQQQ